MPTPLVSVIIPCYNQAHYLPDAVDSVLAQSYENREIIIVNDGSTDETAEVAEALAGPGVRVVHQENKGLAGARNTGIQNSSGALLNFLDSDDLLEPDKLERQVAFLQEHPEFGIVGALFNRIDSEGRRFGSERSAREGGLEFSAAEVLTNGPFVVHSHLVRREWVDRVGGFDETFRAAEDWDLYCRLALAGCRFYRMNRALCSYRMSPGAMTLDGARQTEALLAVVSKTFATPDLAPEFRDLEPRVRTETLMRGMARCYACGEVESGRRYLANALEIDPTITKDGMTRIARRLFATGAHYDVDPKELLARVIENLPDALSESPEPARDLKRRFQQIRYQRARAAGRRLQAIGSLCKYLLTNPLAPFAAILRKIRNR